MVELLYLDLIVPMMVSLGKVLLYLTQMVIWNQIFLNHTDVASMPMIQVREILTTCWAT